jgi:hypothetical protein
MRYHPAHIDLERRRLMGRCNRCKRSLKDPIATIGPVCAAKIAARRRADVRSDFTTEVLEDLVLIVDEDRGAMSVTNDAERVIAKLARDGALAGRRVLYRDSDGCWDELRHDGARFTGFASIGRPVSRELAISAVRSGLDAALADPGAFVDSFEEG